MDHQLISADSHVNEPPDLWQSRVTARFRDRVPRIAHLEQGDAWIIEGAADPINFGLNACAGQRPRDLRPWVRFDEIRPGGYDPVARLAEMDLDGVDAEVLYPTPRLAQGVAANTDADLHRAMVQAYNEWLSEYAGVAPDRFGGLAMLPNRGAGMAVDELRRVTGRPGIRGVVMGCYPNGTLELGPEDDRVWAELADTGLPVSIHVSLQQSMPVAHRSSLPGYGRFFDVPNRIVQIIFAGVLDRFPGLRIVCAEVDCGWVPYFKEQIDNNFRRLYEPDQTTLRRLPSEYVERNFSFTFITDPFGVRNRHAIGVESMLWSSDYPHISADWPHSRAAIDRVFEGVPAGERRQILAGNAARIYQF